MYFKAKYEQLQYMSKEEDTNDDILELNAQLFAAARTNELLVSLRILAQGIKKLKLHFRILNKQFINPWRLSDF